MKPQRPQRNTLIAPTVAILAGGESKRFGHEKALSPISGKKLVEYSIDTAKEISQYIMIVTQKQNAAYEGFKITCHTDILKNCGPLGGIYTALYFSKTQWIAMMPCDMPLLNSSIYSILLSSLTDNHKPIVAVSHKGVEPLVSLWPKASQDIVYTQLQKRVFAIHHVLSKLKATKVEISLLMENYKQELFSNINYQDDLSLVKKYIR
jgi:molybdopterin-guanine dinucleotide biosynthesis protein A